MFSFPKKLICSSDLSSYVTLRAMARKIDFYLSLGFDRTPDNSRCRHCYHLGRLQVCRGVESSIRILQGNYVYKYFILTQRDTNTNNTSIYERRHLPPICQFQLCKFKINMYYYDYENLIIISTISEVRN